jgi:hypothetical protein
MTPQTPSKSLSGPNGQSVAEPDTPPSQYVLASDQTPSRVGWTGVETPQVDSGDEASALTSPPSLAVSKSDSIDIDCAIEELDPQSGSSSLSYGSRYSFNEESMLEVLDNDDGDEDYDSLEDEAQAKATVG